MFSDPTFWFLIAFLAFFAAVGKKLWHFLRDYLDQHSLKIEEKIKDAIRMREEAQTLLGEVRKKNMQAETQAQEILYHAQKQVEHFRNESRLDLENFLKAREKLAKDRIQHAENQALQEVRRQAIFTSTQACKALIKDHLDQQKHTALIDQAIQDIDAQVSKKELKIN